jgi:hypothetical protein
VARQPGQQREQRREVDEARKLVQRRLVNHELVAVVKPLNLRREDDQRHNYEDLRRQCVAADHDHREHNGSESGGGVSYRQCVAIAPLAQHGHRVRLEFAGLA